MKTGIDQQTVCDKLCAFVRTELLAEGSGFNEQSGLSDFGLDSFSLVELLLFCERNFGIVVPESHLTHENLESVAALGRCLCTLPATAPIESPSE